jgi:hypothetical protein
MNQRRLLLPYMRKTLSSIYIKNTAAKISLFF